MEKTNKDELRRRILPILLYCQAQKGDLSLYDTWRGKKDANKKIFYAYYSGLFCRILCVLDSDLVIEDCNVLLDKYNWYDIQEKDLELCIAAGPYGCEVPDALEFIDGIDNVAWKDSGFGNDRDAVCLMSDRGGWSFADVRESIKIIPQKRPLVYTYQGIVYPSIEEALKVAVVDYVDRTGKTTAQVIEDFKPIYARQKWHPHVFKDNGSDNNGAGVTYTATKIPKLYIREKGFYGCITADKLRQINEILGEGFEIVAKCQTVNP